MTRPQKILLLMPLTIFAILLILVSISLYQGNVAANSSAKDQEEITLNTNEASSFFYTGVILGSVVVLELILIIQVARRRRKAKELLKQQLLEEKKRQEMRSMLLAKLDLLMGRYDKTLKTIRDDGVQMENMLLQKGDMN